MRDLLPSALVVIVVLVLILLARYAGFGRGIWPRGPFSN